MGGWKATNRLPATSGATITSNNNEQWQRYAMTVRVQKRNPVQAQNTRYTCAVVQAVSCIWPALCDRLVSWLWKADTCSFQIRRAVGAGCVAEDDIRQCHEHQGLHRPRSGMMRCKTDRWGLVNHFASMAFGSSLSKPLSLAFVLFDVQNVCHRWLTASLA